jgi:cell shape-determining protein MreC
MKNKKGMGIEYIIGIVVALVVVFVIIFMISGGFEKANASSNQVLEPGNLLNLAGGAFSQLFFNHQNSSLDSSLQNTSLNNSLKNAGDEYE